MGECLRHRALDFILARVRKEDRGHGTDCWVWTGNKNEKGYGRGYVPWFGPNTRIHRAAYQLLVGDIPEGLVIDHLCRVKECCNPEHLEPVSDKENRRRAGQISGDGTCIRGHKFSEHRDRHGNCRLCARIRDRSHKESPEARAQRAKYMREWSKRNRDKVNASRRAARARKRQS